MLPGDRELNEVKLKNALAADQLYLADEETVENLTHAEVGFAGPVGLKGAYILADPSLKGARGVVLGANETDHHYVGAEEGRDFKADAFADLAVAREGDGCSRCGEALTIRRGIEVGHVFKLGTKYSAPLGATYLDESGETQTIVMGCYGIGIGRTVAAAIEQNHDENGIIWPVPIAPYHVDVISAKMTDAQCIEESEKLYKALESEGVEVLLDDRDERAGVKFKDADLIGIPYKAVLGPRGLKEGKVELQSRRTGEAEFIPLGEAAGVIRGRIEKESSLLA